MKIWRLFAFAMTLAGGAALVAVMSTATGRAEPTTASARLDLRGDLRIVSRLVECPAGSAGTCAARTGAGLVSGLGRVTEAYIWRIGVGPPTCADGLMKTLAYEVVLVVVAKGELHMALSEGSECVDPETVRGQAQPFTITGGTGVYVGASGTGSVSRSLGQTAQGAVGIETWTGTLEVPGLAFDVTPPTIAGTSGRTVTVPKKARRVRVTYRVEARDAADGAVPVACQPRSGTRFGIGRTFVTCSAADSSGNARTARFAITVKRRR